MKNQSSLTNMIQGTLLVLLGLISTFLTGYLALFERADIPEVVIKVVVNIAVLVFCYIWMIGDFNNLSVRSAWIITASYTILVLNFYGFFPADMFEYITILSISMISFTGITLIAFYVYQKNKDDRDEVFPMSDTTFHQFLKKYYENVESIDYEDSRTIKFERGLKKLLEQFRKDESGGVFVEIYRINKPSGLIDKVINKTSNVRLKEIENHLKNFLKLSGEYDNPCVQSNNLKKSTEKYNVHGCFFGTRTRVTANSNGVFHCRHSGVVVIFSAPVDYQNQPVIED